MCLAHISMSPREVVEQTDLIKAQECFVQFLCLHPSICKAQEPLCRCTIEIKAIPAAFTRKDIICIDDPWTFALVGDPSLVASEGLKSGRPPLALGILPDLRLTKGKRMKILQAGEDRLFTHEQAPTTDGPQQVRRQRDVGESGTDV